MTRNPPVSATPKGVAKSIKPLSQKALKYSQLRAGIVKSLGVLADKFAKLRKPLLTKVSPQLAAADKLRDDILAMLPALEKTLFIEPKSQVFHGVRVGFRKASDTLHAEDIDKSIKAMQSDAVGKAFVKTTLAIDFEGLESLDDAQLAKFGVLRVTGANTAFCTVSDGLEKITKKLGIEVASK